MGHLGPAVGKTGIVMFGRSKLSTLGHKYNVNLQVPESCPDIGCCRPEPAYNDFFIKDGKLVSWHCTDRVCMKAITVDMVCDALENFSPKLIQ